MTSRQTWGFIEKLHFQYDIICYSISGINRHIIENKCSDRRLKGWYQFNGDDEVDGEGEEEGDEGQEGRHRGEDGRRYALLICSIMYDVLRQYPFLWGFILIFAQPLRCDNVRGKRAKDALKQI